MEVLGISGTPTSPSRTFSLVQQAIDFAGAVPDKHIQTSVINLGELDVKVCDGRDPMDYKGDTKFVIEKVCSCDGLIVGTPMYRGSCTGMLKNMFDLIPNDALLGKPVGIIATAGSDHHFLAIEHQLKPLIGFFHGYAIPGAVYANNSHFHDGRLTDDGVIYRLQQLGESVTNFAAMAATTRDPNLGADRPEIKRK